MSPAAGRPGRSRRRPAPSARSRRRSPSCSRRTPPFLGSGVAEDLSGHLCFLLLPWSWESACRSSRSPLLEAEGTRARAPPSSRPHRLRAHNSDPSPKTAFPGPRPGTWPQCNRKEVKSGRRHNPEGSKKHTKVTGSGSSHGTRVSKCTQAAKVSGPPRGFQAEEAPPPWTAPAVQLSAHKAGPAFARLVPLKRCERRRSTASKGRKELK